MAADARQRVQRGCGERSDERMNSRNGHRDRPWDAQAGSTELQIPSCGPRLFFPADMIDLCRGANPQWGPTAPCRYRPPATRMLAPVT
jgi:putative transposase